MTFVVTSRCVGTKETSCMSVCPVDCIHDIGEQVVIDPVECVDCGACVDVCPVDAIVHEGEADDPSVVADAYRRFGLEAP
ncbi:NAD-dependent dihydropyrimidine dehydrogenase PreA subunit [Saccharothrix tamanrassetensis]|uniref:Ferredoxin n=1 Tax=Saccharothrix tamanrassetensis TaxID=1051531 RepID=A0A841CMY5_9PSEU|nr:4Fe-4S binding protein [Saccharothrix tamanrassetensis]MBB5957447.1 NAD-dependent dihydropyrimidine dehydrogenase PreA subunit [Saccharothrix tamanrassetensis]